MTINEYQKEALRTEQTVGPLRMYALIEARMNGKSASVEWMKGIIDNHRLLNGLMGLNGEAGEAIDLFKKHLFQEHEFDREHMAKELGDVAWYLAVSADAIGYSLEEILQMNVEKLRARYPDGFDSNRSIHRADGDK